MEEEMKKQLIVLAMYTQMELYRLDIIKNIQSSITLNDLELWKSKLNLSKDKEETIALRINLLIDIMSNDKINIKELKII
jgi:hypothetical protein